MEYGPPSLEQKLQVKHACLQIAKELVSRDPRTISAITIAEELVRTAKILEKYFEEKRCL